MVAAGGAVLSPYPPEQRGPSVAVSRAQRHRRRAGRRRGRRRGAGAQRRAQHRRLGRRTQSRCWPFPGDVDRPKVAGCLALIRDGAILVRDAGDVLEALGHLALPLCTPAAEAEDRDGAAARGARAPAQATLDDLVAADRTSSPAQVLAALAMLELDGAIERRGAPCAFRRR